MKWLYILELSWKNLMNRKTRTILTISGVIIGVSAITFLIALGYGFERMTTNQIASSNALYVFETNLDNTDVISINEESLAKLKNLNNVDSVEAGVKLAGKVSKGIAKTDAIINGFTSEYIDLANIKFIRGNKFNDKDENKIILSTAVLNLLNIDINQYKENKVETTIITDKGLSPSLEDASEKNITNLEIVGVVDDDKSAFAILPFSFLRREVSLVNYNTVKIKVKDKNKLGETRQQVEGMGFYTNFIGDTISQINSFFTIFRYIVGGFGFIGMLVAILGMFNTLTVSLLERIREIGVLKSNGATKKEIWKLFLSEAVIISFIGGFSGILVGLIIGETTNFIFNLYAHRNGAGPIDFFYAPPYFIIMTIIFIIITGFITGLYPSKRASKIKVLDALKYEQYSNF